MPWKRVRWECSACFGCVTPQRAPVCAPPVLPQRKSEQTQRCSLLGVSSLNAAGFPEEKAKAFLWRHHCFCPVGGHSSSLHPGQVWMQWEFRSRLQVQENIDWKRVCCSISLWCLLTGATLLFLIIIFHVLTEREKKPFEHLKIINKLAEFSKD